LNTAEIKALNDQYIINTYGERKLALVRGKGCQVWDAEGNEYLDMFAGIAVANLGHCPDAVTEAICTQAQTLVHVSNLYYIESQAQLAALLSQNSFADRWFFANCGATAMESALKLARRYWFQKGTPKPTIITMEQSFHGRTMATITATGQPKYQQGFEPLLPGIHYVPFNDVPALEAAMSESVGAVVVEPIQGEGGVRVPAPDYLQKVRALCDAKNVLLIFDEVQVGMGRTGKLFAHEHAGVTPDIMAIAKALGNGVPISAIGCTEEAATGFSIGSHASTFGGNPLCTAAALATLKTMLEPGFFDGVGRVSARFFEGLRGLAEKHESIQEVRGQGLMVGVEMTDSVAPVVAGMLSEGIICGPAGPNVLRFVPPLIITEAIVDRVVATLDKVLGELY
jgi:acetylornithine/N-succinyldiaminopimelate aminotransferase